MAWIFLAINILRFWFRHAKQYPFIDTTKEQFKHCKTLEIDTEGDLTAKSDLFQAKNITNRRKKSQRSCKF